MRKISILILVLLTGLSLASCKKDDNVIIVGLEAGYAPFNWATNSKSEFSYPLKGRVDYVDGYDVQIAKLIAEGLGKKLVIKAIDWAGLPSALDSGEIDLIIAGMTATPARATSILFTDEYFKEEVVVIVKKDSNYANATSLADFNGAKVVAQRGTIYVEYAEDLQGAVPQEHLDTYPLLELAITNKTADILIVERPVAEGMVEKNPDLKFIIFAEGQGFDDVSVSIGLRLGENDLANKINEILNNITQEQRKQMMQQAVLRQ